MRFNLRHARLLTEILVQRQGCLNYTRLEITAVHICANPSTPAATAYIVRIYIYKTITLDYISQRSDPER